MREQQGTSLLRRSDLNELRKGLTMLYSSCPKELDKGCLMYRVKRGSLLLHLSLVLALQLRLLPWGPCWSLSG